MSLVVWLLEAAFTACCAVLYMAYIAMEAVIKWCWKSSAVSFRRFESVKNSSGSGSIQGTDLAKVQKEKNTDEEAAWSRVADQHINVLFSSDFSGTVSVFKEQKLAKRKIRAISSAASHLMMMIYTRDSFELPDVELTDGVTVEKVILDTESVGIHFITDLLKTKDPQYFELKGKRLQPNCEPPIQKQNDAGPAVHVLPHDTTAEQQVARNLALLRGGMIRGNDESHTLPPVVNTTVTSSKTSYAKREAKSVSIGTVQNFGTRDIPPTGSKPGYSTFEATLLEEDGMHVSFRGVQLNELFEANQVQTGDCVEIKALGRTRVAGEDGNGPTFRNEYQLKVLERVR